MRDKFSETYSKAVQQFPTDTDEICDYFKKRKELENRDKDVPQDTEII